ncbi:hypothetical protein [Endozoicomonas sp.]
MSRNKINIVLKLVKGRYPLPATRYPQKHKRLWLFRVAGSVR